MPDWKPESTKKKKLTELQLRGRGTFKRTVLGLDRCCLVHASTLHCDGPLHAHHAVTQQELRKRALHDELWDVRNGMAVCERAHFQHHSRYRPIPFSCLPQRTLEFAHEFGFSEYLQRMYAL